MALTPIDYDLPEKYADWRENQFMTAVNASTNPKYATLLDAPTGSGKSLIGAATQRMIGTNCTYVVTTKQLQDQLIADFPYARTLKGRNNYRCALYPEKFPFINAELCTNTKEKPCAAVNHCEYLRAKAAAIGSPLAILNMSYYLSELTFSAESKFSGRRLAIIDEFDTLEDQLMSFIELSVTKKMLDELGLEPPKYKTKFEAWLDWAHKTQHLVANELDEIEKMLQDPWNAQDFKTIRRQIKLERFYSKLEFFVGNVDENWVWYRGDTMWTFKPVLVSPFAKNKLWKHTDRILGMSATILDPNQMAKNVGLDRLGQGVVYKKLPCNFPKENRPIFYEPVANVIRANMDKALPALAKRINEIIDKYPDDKVLIHTVSYEVCKYLMDNVSSRRLVTHDTKNRAEVLSAFKTSKKPLVLVSPSMDRGVDLPDDQCRVIIVAKCLPSDAKAVTIEGPKSYDQLTTEDKVYSLQDGNMVVVPVQNITSYPYDGNMIRSTKSITEFMVTPDHRALVIPRKDPHYMYMEAKDIPANGYYSVPFTGDWKGVPLPDKLSLSTFTDCKDGGKYQPEEYDTIDFIRFLGWYITEGHRRITTEEHDGYRSWKVVITQKKDTERERIIKLCKKMQLGYIITKESGRPKNIIISGRRFCEAIGNIIPGKSHDKQLPLWLKLAELPLLQALWEEMMHGDGSLQFSTYSYITSSEQLCWDMCDISIKLGYSPRVLNREPFKYELYLRRKAKKGTINTVVNEHYVGDVWCITVPTGNFLAYWGGNFFFTGNCPYPNLGDPQINKRLHGFKDGPRWFAHRTVSTLIQMPGRGMRSKTDKVDTYILDEQFSKLYDEWRIMFHDWFREAIIS